VSGVRVRRIENALRERPVQGASLTAVVVGLCALAINGTVASLKPDPAPRWAAWVAVAAIAYAVLNGTALVPLAARRDPRLPLLSVVCAVAMSATLIGVVAAIAGAPRWLILVGYLGSLAMLGTLPVRQRHQAPNSE
jgi:hypothetical protein